MSINCLKLISSFTHCNQNLAARLFPSVIGLASFHSSCKLERFGPPPIRQKIHMKDKPVDWLPFTWKRRERFNPYYLSGDNIKEIIYDPNDPRPDFEYSEELKNANEIVRRAFTLATANKADRKEVMKREVLKRIQRHPHDFDSLEVQIALKTIQIRALFEHHAIFWRKDARISRVILPIVIQKRYKLLNKLRNIDEARFNWLLKELDLYFDPPKLGVKLERYCKKWDLRRLTKEYCEKMVADKKAEYHKELKAEQEAFIEEKKQLLAWIEAEEKALESDTF